MDESIEQEERTQAEEREREDKGEEQESAQALRYEAPISLASVDKTDDRREYGVRFIRAGRVMQRNGDPSNWLIPVETLRASVEKLNSVPVYIDHAEGSWFSDGAPSVRNLAGITFGPEWNGVDSSIDGGLRLYDRDDLMWLRSLLDQIVLDQAAGLEVPSLGLSIVFYGKHVWQEGATGSERITRAITYVESCDIVFMPGADGRFKEILAALQAGKPVPLSFPLPLGEGIVTVVNDGGGLLLDRREGQAGKPVPRFYNNLVSGGVQVKYCSLCGAKLQTGVEHHCPDGDQAQVVEAPLVPQGDGSAGVMAQLEALGTQMNRLVDVLASREEASVVEGMGQPPRQQGRWSVGPDSLGKVETAFEAMLRGVLPGNGIPPLTGIREFYHLMSGDWEMTQQFHPDRVYLGAVNSSTMANMVANVLNKLLINEFQTYPQWWRPAVTEADFMTLQSSQWISLGGVGELPTVAEGGAYTELTWDDQRETYAFAKKGGYLGITLEAIDKDDTGRLMAAPRALAQAAWMTLGKTIAALFTTASGTGPTMSDGTVLFHSNHANVGTTALSFTAWNTTRIAMMKQTEINSGERLGGLTAPRLLWVPVDLELTALQVLASANEPGTAQNEINPYAEGSEDDRNARLNSARSRLVVVPFWTDANNWMAQADPMLYPSIGLGYRYGRMPEIYSVASPTAGLMFTNDTMPVKVRFFFAVGPTDWRGLYKQNVA